MSSKQDKKLRKEVKRVLIEQAATIIKPKPRWVPVFIWKAFIRIIIK